VVALRPVLAVHAGRTRSPDRRAGAAQTHERGIAVASGARRDERPTAGRPELRRIVGRALLVAAGFPPWCRRT
jgi:hypothetical protein